MTKRKKNKKELKEDYQLEVAINDATINHTDTDYEYIKCDYRAALSFIKKVLKKMILKISSLKNKALEIIKTL